MTTIELRLVVSPPVKAELRGSVTAYVLLDDGWHTKTVETHVNTFVFEVIEALNGRYGDDPYAWPLGAPDDE